MRLGIPPDEHVVVVAEDVGEAVDSLHGLIRDDWRIGIGRAGIDLLHIETALDAPD